MNFEKNAIFFSNFMNQNKNNTLFINGDTFTYILIFMDVDQEKYQAKNKFGF